MAALNGGIAIVSDVSAAHSVRTPSSFETALRASSGMRAFLHFSGGPHPEEPLGGPCRRARLVRGGVSKDDGVLSGRFCWAYFGAIR
jgi:hypothetical protein